MQARGLPLAAPPKGGASPRLLPAALGASLLLSLLLALLALAQHRALSTSPPWDAASAYAWLGHQKMCCRPCQAGEAEQEGNAAPERGNSTAPDKDALSPWTPKEFQKLLRRAEQVYQRHMDLVLELTGTREDLVIPFPESVEDAMARAHWQFGKSEWALSVFRREYLVTPRYPCFEEERVGLWGEGGKWLCMISLHKKAEDLVVYSVGSQGETSFERDVFKLLGVKAHVFDPFVPFNKLHHMETTDFLVFHNYGLGARTGELVEQGTGNVGQVKDVHSIMEELRHSFIDIFKVDCEGCEVQFVDHLNRTTTRDRPIMGQILMEIHKLSNMEEESTLLARLGKLGFRLFHSEVNFFEPGAVFELAFIHESLVKPESERR